MADETITPARFFEELVPAGFEADTAGNPPPDDATLSFHVTGDGGGDWTIRIAGGKMKVERAKASDALITYTVSSADLVDAINSVNGAAPSLIIPPRRPSRPGA